MDGTGSVGAALGQILVPIFQDKFDLLKEKIISYGSCQFPTLGFVVERYKAIESFIPENFWKIKGKFHVIRQ